MASARSILQVVETYEKARITFAHTVAELATRPQNLEVLHKAEVMPLLRPLLLDNVPQVQQNAALALGRLANHSEELAEALVSENILAQVIQSLREQNLHSKKAPASVLKSVAKHSSSLAEAVARAGSVEQLILCLEEFDPSVKECGASGLGQISRHTPKLAQMVVDAGGVSLLVLAAQVCYCLSSIAKHSIELAEVVVAANIFPKIFACLKDSDPQVRRNAATVVREVAKHSPKMVQFIGEAGGIPALVDNVADTVGHERLPGIMALGYIASFDESLANAIIASSGLSPILDALTNEKEDHIKSASAWSLGKIGGHSSAHALAVAEAGALPSLASMFLSPTSSEDLQTKCKNALKAITDQLTHFPALDSLLQGPILPEGILKYVLAQLARILPHDPNARTQFVTSGGFEKLQRLRIESGSELKEHIDKINGYYPIEIVHYYSPGYSDTLLQKLAGTKAS